MILSNAKMLRKFKHREVAEKIEREGAIEVKLDGNGKIIDEFIDYHFAGEVSMVAAFCNDTPFTYRSDDVLTMDRIDNVIKDCNGKCIFCKNIRLCKSIHWTVASGWDSEGALETIQMKRVRDAKVEEANRKAPFIIKNKDVDELVDYCITIQGNCGTCKCKSYCRTFPACAKAMHWRRNGMLDKLKEN